MANTHRQCAVRINNNSKNYMLHNPKNYIDSGYCQKTLTSTIGPSEDGSALFTKIPHAARGCVGVFTYDLYNLSTMTVEKKLGVMFSNPYDFNLYSNYYAVGLFDRKQLCDHSLFDKMYNFSGSEFVRGGAGNSLTHREDGLIITANMTDTWQTELNVNISSSNG